MTREDIIRMADKATIETCRGDGWPDERLLSNLTHFAALVAEAERNRIIGANAPYIARANAYIKALEEAVQGEREACAKVCDELERPNLYGVRECAAAIRARGSKT